MFTAVGAHGFHMGIAVGRGKVAILHIGSEDGRLGGEQEQGFGNRLLLFLQFKRDGRFAGVQMRFQLLGKREFGGGLLVTAFSVLLQLGHLPA